MTKKDYRTQVLIIGSGPAGLSAAIYAARANLEPIVVCGNQPGGQLTITTEVENYPGFIEAIYGPELMQRMQKQAERYGSVVIDDTIDSVDFSQTEKIARGKHGLYKASTVIIATGAQARWLGLPSEEKFLGHGVSGCATCDGFFFKGKTVAVIGGGNSAAEQALHLTHHAKKIYLIHRKNALRSEDILQKRIFNNDKIEIIWNSVLEEVLGEDAPLKFVSGIRIRDVHNDIKTNIALDGVFVAIGHSPNTGIFVNHLDLDNDGYIKTIAGTTNTNISGIFAVGDVQDKVYRQAITAAGTGCMAALDAQKYLANM